jgi:hypothetical protein
VTSRDLMWQMASDFGRVVERHGAGRRGWVIDLGRAAVPRYLTSARGAKLESREMAQAILDGIRVKIARGRSGLEGPGRLELGGS